jgi:hypothetical protein
MNLENLAAIFKTAKFYAVLVGTGATAAAGVAGAPTWLLAVGTALTAIGMWTVPYQPVQPS